MRVVLILIFLTASVLASPKNETPKTWAGLQMDGLTMDLQDPHYAEWLFFYGAGSVMATIGAKDGPDAGLAATGYRWRVRGDWLEFIMSGDKPFRRLRAISVSKNRLVTRTGNGKIAIYKIKRPKGPR
jgi:hypothetical protein